MNSSPSDLIVRDAAGKQRKVRLGGLLGEGGAGTVYALPDINDSVAKIYKPDTKKTELNDYARKLEAMLKVAPKLVDLDISGQPYDRFRGGQRFVQVAWPTGVALDSHNRFVGYVMPSIATEGTASLEAVMDDKDAHQLGIRALLGSRVTLAFQLANVIARLHSSGHYLIDLKPVNLNFYKQTLYMALLDCDGFSILGINERFEAPQHTADYLAPEFQQTGEPNKDPEAQDRFGLATIIFRLLNSGIHPYSGRALDNDVPNEIQDKIAERLYAYGLKPHPRLAPQALSIHDCIPLELRKMFDLAFVGHPSLRPSAEDWGSVLKEYALSHSGRIQHCKVNPEHLHFTGLTCGACHQRVLRDALLNPPPTKIRQKYGRPPKVPVPVAKAQNPTLRPIATKSIPQKTSVPPPSIAPSTAYCTQCGHRYDPTDPLVKFCNQCGGAVPN